MPAPPPSSPDIVIVGAGALGLATAAELALRGRRVCVVDPGGPNASSVAAGMLAPAMEALLDGVSPERARLLIAARDLWPAFAYRTGVEIHREGAEWRGDDTASTTEQLAAMGFQIQSTAGGVRTPDDWRLSPRQALDSLAAIPGLTRTEGQITAIHSDGSGWRLIGTGPAITASAVVLAAGWSVAAIDLPAPVDHLARIIVPIRGQIDRLSGATLSRVMRGAGGYVAPAADGLVAGASMDHGDSELIPNAEQTARHLAMAQDRLAKPLVWRRTQVGVRGASPDGLPMAGAVLPGLAVALAPRRNGWLLAPLVAGLVADALEGHAPGPWAETLNPTRFL